MKKIFSHLAIVVRIWLLTAVSTSLFIVIICGFQKESIPFVFIPVLFAGVAIASIPAAIILWMALGIIPSFQITTISKILVFLLAAFLAVTPYSLLASSAPFNIFSSDLEGYRNSFFINFISNAAFLFFNSIVGISFCLPSIVYVFSRNQIVSINKIVQLIQQFFLSINTKTTTMEEQHVTKSISNSNRILIKGIITGFLILVLLIPTIFISNLVTEREDRQKEVVKEVSSKWSNAQKLAGPFISIPYTESFINSDNKVQDIRTQVIVVANNLKVEGEIFPEQRPRSIYKVLLYKTDLAMQGQYKLNWPADIKSENLDLKNAQICFALSDFKGIEEEMSLDVNNQKLMLTPGLPTDKLGKIGLSAPIDLSSVTAGEAIDFQMKLKLKGSEQLHFIPLGLSSSFSLKSSWPNPSFDGEVLPSQRTINDKGFDANWNFNQANLPFTGVQTESKFSTNEFEFGVSLVQPADQYNKTMRSVKYAILIIGLSFACFFITELLQKKPFHPIQYVLVGFALVIFYTLLLAISEYTTFGYAYLISVFATISLIAIYVKSHFNNWKTTMVFVVILSILYGFIYILISLEDTALLVGSIGLFLILALIMMVSKRINWYGNSSSITNNS